uniref:Ubiquitin carboxyl-terminal hydrolase 47 n=1 Tax=Plectus sambesii TaxID=2011161 RepID=A0A914WMJ7_9BILA
MARKDRASAGQEEAGEAVLDDIPALFGGPPLPGGNRTLQAPPPLGQAPTEEEMLPGTSAMGDGSSTSAQSPSLTYSDELALDDNDHRYVGLVNQAMTCYLNSLIQTLYMTPEFRNALYDWEFAGSTEEEAKNIPCQLQKLFLLLQTSDRGSLETKDLTASFGWDSSEAYDQHDVQELCRLMFDALERRWRKTKNSSLIQDLYRGTMQDFVKCLKCNTENVREDVFLDLPLAVKQFGAREAFKSVEDALHAFIRPEVLDGSNQYECAKCKEKTDAHKGLRITQFPYLLTIQLKRFDFDYNTLHRVKLNDKMTFPDLLNLNPFVYDPTKDERMDTEEPTQSSSEETSLPEPFSTGHLDRERIKRYLAQGKYVYELFSVMVHSGSAAGGHYFAYIKNIDQDKWYCFNDSSVKIAVSEDIQRTFGGPSGGWSYSNTNAYMLMYRQIDAGRNAKFVKSLTLPPHLVQLKERWQQEEEEKHRQKALENSLIRVMVTWCPFGYAPSVKEDFMIPNTETMQTVFDKSFERFDDLQNLNIKRENCRLIKSSTTYFIELDESFESGDEEAMSRKLVDVFPNLTYAYKPDVWLLLDAKPPSAPFRPITKTDAGKTVTFHRVCIDAGIIYPERVYFFFNDWTVQQAKEFIAERYETSWENVRIVMDAPYSSTQSIILFDRDDEKIEHAAHISSPRITLFVDVGMDSTRSAADRSLPFAESRLCAILERKKYATTFVVKLPSPVDYTVAGMEDSRSNTPLFAPTSSAHKSRPGNGSSATLSPASTLTDCIDVRTITTSPSPMVTPNLTPQASPSVSPCVSSEDESATSSKKKRQISLMYAAGGDMVASLASPPPLQACWPLQALNSGNLVHMSSDTVATTGTTPSTELADEVPPLETADSSSSPDDPPSSSDAGAKSSTFSVVVDDSDVKQNTITISVDKRMLVKDFKQWLADYLVLDNTQFVLMKCHASSEYEASWADSATMETFSTVNAIGIKLGAPLKENEKLIKMIRFDMQESEDKWQTLFEIPISSDMTGAMVAEKCKDMLLKACCLDVDSDCLRVREVVSGRGIALVGPNETMNDRQSIWTKDLLIQILDEPDPCRNVVESMRPIFIRRWHPSTLELLPVREIAVPVKADMSELLAEIGRVSAIPADRVEITEASPSSCWDKYPFWKDRLVLLNETNFFSEWTNKGDELTPLTDSGQLIYFRDKEEVAKDLSEEDRKAVRIQDNQMSQKQNSWTIRRKERPLRIQMSSSIADDLD